jgi:AraC family transcriptional regulator, arabinose operon regulatory protein
MCMEQFPFKILNGGYSLCGRQWGIEGKFNVPFFRLYFVVSGKAQIMLGGKHFELKEANVYFLPSNIISQNSCNDFMKVFWIHFAPISLSIEFILAKHKEIYAWPLEDLKSWENIYIQLKQFPFYENSPENYKLHSLLLYLTADLFSGITQTISNTAYAKLKKAINFMDNEYINNPSLKEIAKKANMAPNYFHRKFKESFPDFTPHSYMEARRMRDAKALLTTELSLDEISEVTGYSNVFYFSRSFKKVFGKSPSFARKEINP